MRMNEARDGTKRFTLSKVSFVHYARHYLYIHCVPKKNCGPELWR